MIMKLDGYCVLLTLGLYCVLYTSDVRKRARDYENHQTGEWARISMSLPHRLSYVEESVFVSRVFVLLIMERYCTLNSYLSIINKINTHKTNTDSSTTTRLQV